MNNSVVQTSSPHESLPLQRAPLGLPPVAVTLWLLQQLEVSDDYREPPSLLTHALEPWFLMGP